MVTKNEVKKVVKAALCVLDLDKIQSDSSYQREIKPKHLKIVSDFNEDALGVPLVGQREDGSYWIVDGLQRIAALLKMGKKTIRAEVFASQGPEHEATIFKLVNMNRTKLNAIEEFRALLTSHDELAWKVKDTIEAYGYKISMSSQGKMKGTDTSKQLTCIKTLLSEVGRFGTEALQFTLTVIDASWPGDPLGVYNGMIAGMCSFWRRRKELTDLERFIARCKTVTPQRVLYTAQQMKLTQNLETAVADQLEKVYRKKRA